MSYRDAPGSREVVLTFQVYRPGGEPNRRMFKLVPADAVEDVIKRYAREEHNLVEDSFCVYSNAEPVKVKVTVEIG